MNDNAIQVMKLNVLDTHDRFLELNKSQSKLISDGVEECIKRNPDSLAIQEVMPYFYIFAHPRTSEDGSAKRLLWQPRVTRPTPQTNSMCFRVLSKTDNIEICWLIPAMEVWGANKKGNIGYNDIVDWSIKMYLHNRAELQKAHPQDWSEEATKQVFMKLLKQKNDRKFKPDLPELKSETDRS